MTQPKPKFRVGQVVARRRPDYGFEKVARIESYSGGFLYYMESGWHQIRADEIRPLTRKEAGR